MTGKPPVNNAKSKPALSNKAQRKMAEVDGTGETFLTDMLFKGRVQSKP